LALTIVVQKYPKLIADAKLSMRTAGNVTVRIRVSNPERSRHQQLSQEWMEHQWRRFDTNQVDNPPVYPGEQGE
jgi:hypothetical protein